MKIQDQEYMFVTKEEGRLNQANPTNTTLFCVYVINLKCYFSLVLCFLLILSDSLNTWWQKKYISLSEVHSYDWIYHMMDVMNPIS